MRVYKEKHIKYDFTLAGVYSYAATYKEGRGYSGPIILWKGEAFAGTKMSRDVEINNLLMPSLDGDNPMEDEMIRDYNALRPDYVKYIDTPSQINFRPTKKDRGKGFCFRHFVKWEENIYEVDKKQYDKFSASQSVYKESLYFAKLKHQLQPAGLDLNRSAIAAAEIKIEGIKELVSPTDLMEVTENLYTNGGEFHMGRGWNAGFTKVPDEREYIGFYHIHPEYGPMAGKFRGEQGHLTIIPMTKPGSDYDPKIQVPDA